MLFQGPSLDWFAQTCPDGLLRERKKYFFGSLNRFLLDRSRGNVFRLSMDGWQINVWPNSRIKRATTNPDACHSETRFGERNRYSLVPFLKNLPNVLLTLWGKVESLMPDLSSEQENNLFEFSESD